MKVTKATICVYEIQRSSLLSWSSTILVPLFLIGGGYWISYTYIVAYRYGYNTVSIPLLRPKGCFSRICDVIAEKKHTVAYFLLDREAGSGNRGLDFHLWQVLCDEFFFGPAFSFSSCSAWQASALLVITLNALALRHGEGEIKGTDWGV